MTKRARVMAALHGELVDRVPVSFWAHNFAEENSAEALARETLRIARTFDWDFLKPQSRAQAFAEMWGLTYTPSAERATSFTVTHTPCASGEDLARLRPADPRTGALGEQLAALDAIRAEVGADTPIIWTIFAPLMVAKYLFGDEATFTRVLHEEPQAMERGLAAIGETLAEYARACLEHGADGLFYATNVATRDRISPDECRRYQRPFDLPILEAVQTAPFNLMHVCGADTYFDEFADYPATAFSWALGAGNPSLSEGHQLTGKAVVGGIPAKPTIKTMTPEAVAERAERAIREMKGRWLLLGPDCSINPDTPDKLLFAARDAARQAAA